MKSSKKGFTIIEVVLVLAIAGLVVLMVFIALPALQRSQRNTQRRRDLSTIQAAFQEWHKHNGIPVTDSYSSKDNPNGFCTFYKKYLVDLRDPNTGKPYLVAETPFLCGGAHNAVILFCNQIRLNLVHGIQNNTRND